jgi:hypothetical protein
MGVKQPGHEANLPPQSSAEVKNAWSYTSNPPHVSMAWCLVKHRNNLTFNIRVFISFLLFSYIFLSLLFSSLLFSSLLFSSLLSWPALFCSSLLFSSLLTCSILLFSSLLFSSLLFSSLLSWPALFCSSLLFFRLHIIYPPPSLNHLTYCSPLCLLFSSFVFLFSLCFCILTHTGSKLQGT